MKYLWNDGWQFIKETIGVEVAPYVTGEAVTLPHTWNAKDGQDGGNDYYRGTCRYVKKFKSPTLKDGEEAWLEFCGIAMTAEVWLNGQTIARHEGGYSTFRVNLTPALKENNTLVVSVDNGRNRTVYPQKADFTFYGGIYRDVHLLIVPSTHFTLDYYGGPGIKITPIVKGANAEVMVETYITGQTKKAIITAAGQTQEVPVEDGYAKAVFTIEDVHLWNGVDDPYLYTASARLDSGDHISADFGCRSF